MRPHGRGIAIPQAGMSGMRDQGSDSQRFRRKALNAIIAAFFMADVILFGYIFSGYLFASHIAIPDQRIIAPARSYDQSAKPSPLIVWRPAPRKAKAAMPVIDATTVAQSGDSASAVYRTVSGSAGAAEGVSSQGRRAAPAGAARAVAERNDTT
jgi:heme/copper-type cytochrome/quinol oxidase subunit 3